MNTDATALKYKILDLDSKLEEYRKKAFSLGLRKMFISGGGFNYNWANGNFDIFKMFNHLERVGFSNEYIIIIFTNDSAESQDFICHTLSYEELMKSEDEAVHDWEKEKAELIHKKQLKKETEEEVKKLKIEEDDYKKYLKLKERFEKEVGEDKGINLIEQ